MKPILFHIGSIGISSYYFMGVVGVIVGFILLAKEADRKGLDRRIAVNAATWAAVFGYLGARIMHIIFDGFFEIYLKKPIAMLYFWKGGLAFYGAVIFGLPAIVGYLWKKKQPLVKYLDLFTYPIALGVALGRVGCYLNGCCFGDITSSPCAHSFIKWGLSAKNQFARDMIHNLREVPFPVIPTQLVSFGVNILIFLFLYLFVRKRYTKDGVPFGLWLILYSIFRFTIEFFRADDRGLFFGNTLSTSQLISIVSIVIGILLIYLPAENGEAKGA